jgi:hypothetical protein
MRVLAVSRQAVSVSAEGWRLQEVNHWTFSAALLQRAASATAPLKQAEPEIGQRNRCAISPLSVVHNFWHWALSLEKVRLLLTGAVSSFGNAAFRAV